jgi:AAA domain
MHNLPCPVTLKSSPTPPWCLPSGASGSCAGVLSNVDTVQALAGTGKTTMLRTLGDAYARAGYQVIGGGADRARRPRAPRRCRDPGRDAARAGRRARPAW